MHTKKKFLGGEWETVEQLQERRAGKAKLAKDLSVQVLILENGLHRAYECLKLWSKDLKPSLAFEAQAILMDVFKELEDEREGDKSWT